ncbi:uncharacterized protein FTJAE_12520 [Fusarium tjaetaba]|uniref:Uncharacterized protein n=1 Tax=Fusarium tjaetaba TaxID=1567544 RepID=A0A8H5QM42_9HYPO|nr:uncharacterized protein FTJAE_12520 [Fusarium tjaetaba]KAF5617730.1 hypothetical protein FTJAE_12520 [Fusarium tjaetaba]
MVRRQPPVHHTSIRADHGSKSKPNRVHVGIKTLDKKPSQRGTQHNRDIRGEPCRSIMPTFNGIVSEFPDIRIEFNTRAMSTFNGICLGTQTHNRSIMPTFDGIVSEFPDIRIDFTNPEDRSPSPVQQNENDPSRVGLAVFNKYFSIFKLDTQSAKAQARWTNPQPNNEDHQEGPPRKKARTSTNHLSNVNFQQIMSGNSDTQMTAPTPSEPRLILPHTTKATAAAKTHESYYRNYQNVIITQATGRNCPDPAPATKKRGRPAKNSIEESATAREFAEKISENTRAFRRENVDSYVGELIRPPRDGWSQAHEDAMTRMWEETDHKEAVGGMLKNGKTTQAHLLSLFKVCLRVYKMSPIRFMSFSLGVEYLGDRGSSAVFSRAYSDELARLIVHPAFNGKKDNVAVAMQYAVICRIDDRRLWPETTSRPACPALIKMVEVMNESETGESEDSIHRTHLECRRECAREGKTPSKISDLLFAIGETVKKPTVKGIEVSEEAKSYRGLPVRPVSLYDLRHIKKTLDETTWPVEAWNCTTTEALFRYQSVIAQAEAPNAEELPIYFERAHKRKLRDWMLKSNYDPQVEEESEGAGIDQGESDNGSPQVEEDFQFGGFDQGGDDTGSPITVNAPSNPEPSNPEPRHMAQRPPPLETLANVAAQRPGLVPDEYNPYLSVGQGVGSPSKSELLAQVNNQGKKIADQEKRLAKYKGEVDDLRKRVAALETGQGKRNDNTASRYHTGHKSPKSSSTAVRFEARLLPQAPLSVSPDRGQSEDRESLLEPRSDSPAGSHRGMADDFDETGSYHGMDNNDDEPISPSRSVRERSIDHEGSKHSFRQGSVPPQLPSDRPPVLDDFRQSQHFADGVKNGSIMDTGIPRSQVQRQRLLLVLLANTPFTGVGCLKARSSHIARRTHPLYRMAYVDKVKDL